MQLSDKAFYVTKASSESRWMSLFSSSSSLLYSLFYSASRSLRERPAAAAARQARKIGLLTRLLAYKLALPGMPLPTEHRATLLARFLQFPRALPCLLPVSQAARRAALSPARFHPSIAPPHPSPLPILDSSRSPGHPARALRSNGFLTSPTPPSPPASTDTVDARFD